MASKDKSSSLSGTDGVETVTPEQVTRLMSEDREAFIAGLLDGQYRFDDKYVKYRSRLSWSGWWPHIEHHLEFTDGTYGLRIE